MTQDRMRISVIGAGYVGLSLSILLARKHDVTVVDIVESKIDSLRKRVCPIRDEEMQRCLESESIALNPTMDTDEVQGSDFVIIATPTNYNPETNEFDTSSVESAVESVRNISPGSTIVIKSTIPIGYLERCRDTKGWDNVIFSPEFLREGHALYDNLHPSRIIVGVPFLDDSLIGCAGKFAELLKDCSESDSVKTIIMSSTEAESVKLFSNAYLAMRVSFFNELDTFAETCGLNSERIIEGVCADPRIGMHYNNPSFGYGGYCLPKDTKQLLTNYQNIPNSIIGAIVESNAIRKGYIANRIEKLTGEGSVIGIYRLTMKFESDNLRESSIIDVVKALTSDGFKVVIYEPLLRTEYPGTEICNDFDEFCDRSDIIVTNRIDEKLSGCKKRIYTRDIFNSN